MRPILNDCIYFKGLWLRRRRREDGTLKAIWFE